MLPRGANSSSARRTSDATIGSVSKAPNNGFTGTFSFITPYSGRLFLLIPLERVLAEAVSGFDHCVSHAGHSACHQNPRTPSELRSWCRPPYLPLYQAQALKHPRKGGLALRMQSVSRTLAHTRLRSLFARAR